MPLEALSSGLEDLNMRNAETIIILALAMALAFSGCVGNEDDPDTDDQGGQDPGPDGEMGDPEAPNQTGMVIHETSASWLVGVSGCVGVAYLSVTDGVDSAWGTIPSEAQGQPFNATFESAAPAVTYGLSFGAGDTLNETFDASEAVVEGTVPSDAENVIFWTCGGVEVTVSFTVVSG